MKRLAIVALLAMVAVAGFAQTTVQDYQDALVNFSNAFLGTLAVNSTTGETWSDAYIGGFPHFGAGLSLGAMLADKAAVLPVFTQLGLPIDALPPQIQQYGLPIPTATLTAKIGLPFLPMDIGGSFGYIWPEAGAAIASSLGMQANYLSAGANVRFAVLSEETSFMDLSIGAGVNYVKGSISKTMSGQSARLLYDLTSAPINGNSWQIDIGNPVVAFDWQEMNYDFTLQASKKILFFTLYAGGGFTYGNGQVNSSVKSTMTLTTLAGGNPNTLAELQNEAQAAAQYFGVSVPSFDATGFAYSVNSGAPVWRAYGGLSLDILVVLDLQGIVVFKPQPNGQTQYDYGASATIRVQL